MADRNQVFVFGSNRQGRHGKGAAKFALENYGAIYGQANGRQSNSYAIVTKELRSDYPPVTLPEVRMGVRTFIDYATKHPDEDFEVTPIGCGLAGFKVADIAPLFSGAPSNVHLAPELLSVLEDCNG